MAEISCWRQFFYLPISNLWMALISEPPVRFGWITPLLFSYMRLNTFHVIFLLTSAVSHQLQEKCVMRHHSIPFAVTEPDFQKKNRKCPEYVGTGPDSFLCWLDYFWVSYGNQTKQYFWITAKKICSRQQKINDNDAIIFWYFERTIQ